MCDRVKKKGGKIRQIIPAQGVAYYKSPEEEDLMLPIVCIALIEWKDGSRTIEFMDTDDCGEIDMLSENVKYIEVQRKW